MSSNRDQRTLLDKMVLLIGSLGLKEPFYFVADAYYAIGNIVGGLLAQGNHLVTRVKSNNVAFFQATLPPQGRLAGAHRHASSASSWYTIPVAAQSC